MISPRVCFDFFLMKRKMSPHLNFCVDLIFPKKNVSNTFGEEELEAQGVRLLTWSNMTGCSTYGRRHLRFTRLGKYPGKSEITNLGLEVVVKQDVAGLTSRWMMAWSCMSLRPLAVSVAMPTLDGQSSRPLDLCSH